MGKQNLVFLTREEIAVLEMIASTIVAGDGRVEWKLPVSPESVMHLKTASEKLEKKLDEIDESERE